MLKYDSGSYSYIKKVGYIIIKVNIESGICGFKSIVQAEPRSNYTAKLSLESNCPHVTKIVHNLGEFNAMDELFKKGQSKI